MSIPVESWPPEPSAYGMEPLELLPCPPSAVESAMAYSKVRLALTRSIWIQGACMSSHSLPGCPHVCARVSRRRD